jgi:CHASE3 domain sensor protein
MCAAIFGSGSLFFVVLGFVYLELIERRAQGPQLILTVFGSLSVLGGILSTISAQASASSTNQVRSAFHPLRT